MSDDNRVYTFLISPSRTSRVRQLSINRNLLRTIAGVGVISLVLVLYGAVRLAQHEVDVPCTCTPDS